MELPSDRGRGAGGGLDAGLNIGDAAAHVVIQLSAHYELTDAALAGLNSGEDRIHGVEVGPELGEIERLEEIGRGLIGNLAVRQDRAAAGARNIDELIADRIVDAKLRVGAG